MIKYYFTVAWRHLRNKKFYSLINIAGFALGIAFALLLGGYSWYELNCNNFHQKKDQIYLVGADSTAFDLFKTFASGPSFFKQSGRGLER
ncbi:MAG: hypothetical protein ACNS62_08055 [Candidatus Cyclobacteriaceae bacterium M3_2C_046]